MPKLNRPMLAIALVAAMYAGRPAYAGPLLDVVFDADADGAMSLSGFIDELAFLTDAVNSDLPFNTTQTAMVQYSTGATTPIPLTLVDNATISSLDSQINNLHYTEGETDIEDAVNEAINVFDTDPNGVDPKLMVLLADHQPTPDTGSNSQNPCSPANASTLDTLQSDGITTVLIAVGSQINPNSLSCLGNDVITVDSWDDLGTSGALGELQTYISDAQSVPEPADWSVFAVGLGAMARRRRGVRTGRRQTA